MLETQTGCDEVGALGGRRGMMGSAMESFRSVFLASHAARRAANLLVYTLLPAVPTKVLPRYMEGLKYAGS